MRGAHDDDITGDRWGTVPPNLTRQRVDDLVVVQLEVDDAVDPERRHGPTRLGLQRDELIADGHNVDTRVTLAVGPIADAAARHTANRVAGPLSLIDAVEPQQLAGRPVQGHHIPAAPRGRVEDAIDHERRGLIVEVRERPKVHGTESPRHLEIVEVVAVNLVERRVSRAAKISAIGLPLTVGRARLGRRNRGAARQRQHDHQRPANPTQPVSHASSSTYGVCPNASSLAQSVVGANRVRARVCDSHSFMVEFAGASASASARVRPTHRN